MLAILCLLAAADPAPANAVAESPFGSTEKTRIVVMDLKLVGVPPDFGQSVVSLMTESLDSIGPFRAISSRDIGNMLDFEAKKMEIGCVDEVSCLSEIAGAFGAEYVVTGSLTNADGVYLLQLQLLDIAKAGVSSRERRTTESKTTLFDVAETAAQALVRPLLEARSGTLQVNVTEEGASIKVDRRIVGTSPMGALTLPAGVHIVEVEKQGFVLASKDVSIEQDKTATVELTLRPSEDYKRAYVQSAMTMRIAAIATASAGALAGGTGAVLFFIAGAQADALRGEIQTYNAATVRTAAQREQIDRDLSLVGTLDTTALVLGITGVTAIGVGTGMFFLGGDPARYDE
jgi:hypothetical protein